MKSSPKPTASTIAFGMVGENRLIVESVQVKYGGFTLIEMLITMGIIVGLACLILPYTKSALEHSRGARCMASLRQIGLAINLYATDHNQEIPPGNLNGSEWFNLGSNSWLREYAANGSEAGTKALLRCPSDQTAPPVSDYKYYYSYTWNSELLQAYVNSIPANGRIPTKALKVQRKILFADAITHAEDPSAVPKYPASTTSQNIAARISKRHQGGANCLFGDGSVSWLSQENTQDPNLWRRDP